MLGPTSDVIHDIQGVGATPELHCLASNGCMLYFMGCLFPRKGSGI